MRRFIALADTLHVSLASLLGTTLLLRVIGCAGELEPVGFAVGLLLGYVLADIASGLVHWFCDTYFAPTTRLVGPMFIAPFREHHVDPSALGRHGMFERNGNNCLGSLPFLLLGLRAFESDIAITLWLDLGRGLVVAFAITLCLTNQIHAWAHTRSNARLPDRTKHGSASQPAQRNASAELFRRTEV